MSSRSLEWIPRRSLVHGKRYLQPVTLQTRIQPPAGIVRKIPEAEWHQAPSRHHHMHATPPDSLQIDAPCVLEQHARDAQDLVGLVEKRPNSSRGSEPPRPSGAVLRLHCREVAAMARRAPSPGSGGQHEGLERTSSRRPPSRTQYRARNEQRTCSQQLGAKSPARTSPPACSSNSRRASGRVMRGRPPFGYRPK